MCALPTRCVTSLHWRRLWLAAILVTTIRFCASGKANSTECELQVKQCLDHLKNITMDPDLAFPTTKPHVEEMCKIVNKVFDCVDEFISRCLTPSQRKVYRDIITNAMNMHDEICMNAEIRKEYMSAVPCYKKVVTNPSKCSRQYSRIVETYEKLNSEADERTIINMCCDYDDFVNCTIDYIARDCDAVSAEVMTDYVLRSARPNVKTCSSYTDNPNYCISRGSALGACLQLLCLLLAFLVSTS